MNRPRNVIWMTTDHMRFDGIAAHGNPALHTPNLDALVAHGTTFTSCFANNPICMPSRCSFMTSCYPPQTGVLDNGQELPADFHPTAARCFKAGGYRAVQIGKLHLQGHEDHDLDPRARHDYGFEVLQISEEPGCYEDAYRTWLRGEYPDLVGTFTVPRPMSPARHTERETFRVLDAPWQASHSGWVATQACRYLGAWGPREAPQFMHLGFYAPHPPLNPTREMFAPYRDAAIPAPARSADDPRDPHDLDQETLREYRRHFYAMITGVDLAVGMLVERLRQLDLYEDTLLVFGSDHGDACGDHGCVGKDPRFYEPVMRVPWILHWPHGLGREPRRIDELVEMVDVLPTLLDLAGIRPDPAMQGRSCAEALREGAPVEGRSDVFAVHGRGQAMLRTDRYTYLCYPDGDGFEDLLFDLRKDPHEFHNRAGDPALAAVRNDLRDRLLRRSLAAGTSIRPTRLRF